MTRCLLLLVLTACAGGTPDCPRPETWYVDADGDGFGAEGEGEEACSAPAGQVDRPGDCDDGDPEVYFGAAEVCDGKDNDCDGIVDPDDAVDVSSCFEDHDGDGHGAGEPVSAACDCPAGQSHTDDDCDDYEADAYPGNTETWYDDIDGDCLGGDDDDADGDGHKWEKTVGGDDCDDQDPETYPGAVEICGDGVDQDCDEQDPDPDCGLVGILTADDAQAVVVNQAPAVFGYAAVYAGDADGDGVGEVLSARYVWEEAEAPDVYGTQVVYALHNLTPHTEQDFVEDALAVFLPPGWTIDAPYDEVSPLSNSPGPLLGGADLDGDGYPDYLLGSSNTVARDGGLPSRVDLWYGPASGVIDLSEADSVVGEDPFLEFGVPMALTAADHDGSFQVAVAGAFDRSVNGQPGVYLLDQNNFSGAADFGEGPVLWKPDNWAFGRDLRSADLDGDGVRDLVVKAWDPDHPGDSTLFATFAGPLAADLELVDSDMTIDCGPAYAMACSYDASCSFNCDVAILDADESPDGKTYLAALADPNPCDDGVQCGGAWIHPYEEGIVVYDEDYESQLVGEAESRIGAISPASWGGDLDGDGAPELYVYTGQDYRDHDSHGGSVFVVEVPESGTWKLSEIYDGYLASEGSTYDDNGIGMVTTPGHDWTGDGIDDLVTTSLGDSSVSTHLTGGSIYLFPGGDGEP